MPAGLLALALAVVFVGCSEEDAFQSVDPPNMTVDPPTVEFAAVPVGETTTEQIQLQNVGEGTLVVSALELIASGEYSIDTPQEALPIRMEGGEVFSIRISYAPTSDELRSGVLRIAANDPDLGPSGVFEVQLQPQQAAPRLFVAPDTVDFGRVVSGDTVTQPVNVQNVGTLELIVDSIRYVGSTDFELIAEALPNPDAPLVLDPSETFTFEVEYSPSTNGFDEGDIFIQSNDPNNENARVPVTANGAEPCLAATDEESGIDFSEVQIGTTAERTITISNCSDPDNGATLRIDGIGWVNEGDETSSPAFTLSAIPAPLPDGALELEPEESSSFLVRYTPTAQTADSGTIRILSNDEQKQELDIAVRGIGAISTCPTAVAKCRIVGARMPFSDEVEAEPLDTLECDGRESHDSTGDPVTTYQWEVISRPDGSVTTFEPGSTQPNPNFFLDLVGPYILRLTVFDENGNESCEPAHVSIQAIPQQDVHIQLIWDTPADPDQTDTGGGAGSDMDLHLLHPDGTWNDEELDCYWENENPNWGQLSRRDDDPSLDRDDRDGAGPENINFDNPEEDLIYTIGVNYFNSHGFGASTATLRVFIQTVLVWESSKEFERTGQFWEAGEIHWPDTDVVVVDEFFDAIP